MPWDTLAEIETDIWGRAGLGTVSSTGDFYAVVRRAIERAYHELCDAHPFLWLRAAPPGVFRTIDDITTGTINVTNGQTAATLSSAPAASVANREIRITGWNEVFRISAHTAGAAGITLDSAFNGTTTTAARYTIFQREYALDTDVKEILEMHVMDGGGVIDQVDEADLLRDDGDVPSAIWPPTQFARIGQQRIRLEGYPDRTRRVEYAHTVIPADIVDGATILVPRNFRYVIADGGLYWTYVSRNDDRADAAGILYAAGTQKMIEADKRNRVTLGRAPQRRRAVYV